MKNIARVLLLCGLAAIAPVSCREDEIEGYNGPESMNLALAGSDPDMTFLDYAPDVMTHTFEMEARLVGYAAGAPRTVEIAVIETMIDGRAAEIPAAAYTIPATVTLAAGEHTAPVALVVNRDAIADQGAYEVVVGVVDNKDFSGGYNRSLKLSFTRAFPTEWYDSLVAGTPYMSWGGYWLGACTKARYKYFYEYFKQVDIAPWSTGMMTMMPYITDMNNQIIIYNSQFGDDQSKWLKDDDGTNLYMGLSRPAGL
jgi:hypothetical protein